MANSDREIPLNMKLTCGVLYVINVSILLLYHLEKILTCTPHQDKESKICLLTVMVSEVPRLASYVLAETVSAIYNTHQDWPQILEWLVSSIASNDDEKFREVALLICGVLYLEKILTCTPHQEKESKIFLLIVMESEVPRLAYYVLAETVSAIYNTHDQDWPQILEWLVFASNDDEKFQDWSQILEWLVSSIASNDDDKFLEVALLVLSSLPNECCFLVCDALRDRVRVFHSSFLSSLASSNPNIQVSSFGAVVSLVPLFSDPSLFHELLCAMMAGVLIELINLVSQEPLLMKPYVSDMVLEALQIAESEGLTKETHRLAFELVMAITELKEYRDEHVLLNLPSHIVVRFFLVPMKMLLRIEEDGDHDHALEGEEKVDDVYRFGIKCLKQLCVTLGGSKVLAIASELLPLYLDSKEWKKRHAGITMLTVISKEFSDEKMGKAASAMLFFLRNTLPESLSMFKDVDTEMGKLLSLNLQPSACKCKEVLSKEELLCQLST